MSGPKGLKGRFVKLACGRKPLMCLKPPEGRFSILVNLISDRAAVKSQIFQALLQAPGVIHRIQVTEFEGIGLCAIIQQQAAFLCVWRNPLFDPAVAITAQPAALDACHRRCSSQRHQNKDEDSEAR